MNKKQLRRIIRQQRRTLSTSQQLIASQRFCQHFLSHPKVRAGRRIALFLASDGEINPRFVIEQLWRRKQHVYLPVLHPIRKSKLSFIRYTPTTAMQNNRFGILEPKFKSAQALPPAFLSVIGLPLVAFDTQGHRLGMGGGFYDRTLAFMQDEKKGPKPFLLGCAHDFQCVPILPAEPWDIRLHAVATDKKLYRMNPFKT